MVEHEDEDEKFAPVEFHIPFPDWLCYTSNRRTRLSGKRRAIDDDSLIITAEKLREIREAEGKTKQTKAKKRKVGKQKTQQVKNIFNNKFEIKFL